MVLFAKIFVRQKVKIFIYVNGAIWACVGASDRNSERTLRRKICKKRFFEEGYDREDLWIGYVLFS